jgi:hypothetical protein
MIRTLFIVLSIVFGVIAMSITPSLAQPAPPVLPPAQPDATVHDNSQGDWVLPQNKVPQVDWSLIHEAPQVKAFHKIEPLHGGIQPMPENPAVNQSHIHREGYYQEQWVSPPYADPTPVYPMAPVESEMQWHRRAVYGIVHPDGYILRYEHPWYNPWVSGGYRAPRWYSHYDEYRPIRRPYLDYRHAYHRHR